jgi:hypothetical protein
LTTWSSEWVASTPGAPVHCYISHTVGFVSRQYQIIAVNSTTKTVTVDRPIDVAFRSAFGKAWVIVPPQIEIIGGGGVIRGSGDRLIQIVAGWRCVVEDLTLISEPTAVSGDGITGFMGAFDIAGHNNTLRHVRIDGGGTNEYMGWSVESNTAAVISDVEIRGVTGPAASGGLYVYENHGSVFQNVRVHDCVFGFLIDAYDSTYLTQYVPNTDLLFSGCDGSGNSRYGFHVNSGASRIQFVGCTANYNQQHGFAITKDTYPGIPTNNISLIGCEASYNGYHGFEIGSLTTGTQLKNLTALGNAGCAIQSTADFVLDGFTFSDCLGSTDSGNNSVILCLGGSATIANGTIARAEASATNFIRAIGHASSGTVDVRNVTAKLVMAGWVATSVLDHSAGVMRAENVVLDPASSHVSYGYAAWTAGVTFVRGTGIVFETAAVPYQFGVAGTFQNWGTVVASGTTAVDVTYPQIKAADTVVLTRTVNGGTPGITPRVTITPGTKFTITGVAGDTSTYGFRIL